MKKILFGYALAALMGGGISRAATVVPSDGSDGALVVTNNLVIDLSKAVSTTWNANNSTFAGSGVYDSSKWAVVFKYSKVQINGGFTVSFVNHPSHAPVVWLVSGDVSIDGTLSLDGQDWVSAPGLSEPGPGGFRGGSGYYSPGAGDSAGFGPGGGQRDTFFDFGTAYSSAGSYGSGGTRGSETYGNASLVPLVGGSGGAGNTQQVYSGGAGAGAILIASAGTLSIAGSVHANGGSGGDRSGPGSGGGIRLVATTLDGNGSIQCLGGRSNAGSGGVGRVRIERVHNANALTVSPDPSVVQLSDGDVPVIWPPTSGPSVQIVSIGGVNAPTDPLASFGTTGADVTLPQSSSTTVLIVTTNVEQASQVLVRACPRSGGSYSETAAGVDVVLNQNPLVIQWKANIPVQSGYGSVVARVIRP